MAPASHDDEELELIKTLHAGAATSLLERSTNEGDSRKCAACCARLRDLAVPEARRSEVLDAGGGLIEDFFASRFRYKKESKTTYLEILIDRS